MDTIDFPACLEAAKAAAGRAAAALRDRRGEWARVLAVQDREVKVRADREAEAMIVDDLNRATAFPILSEETGWIGGGDREVVWAVDPLDGSVNYLQGYPHCGVSIALLVSGAPVLGVVDLFMLGESYAGLVGHGATLNEEPIAVSQVSDPARGVLNTGIPARARTDPEAMASLARSLARWRKVRMIGSAAAALAYVAAGRADAYGESGAMVWDVAGGCALVRAAGGRAGWDPGPLDQPLIVNADNGRFAG